jgi:hypothetical protein
MASIEERLQMQRAFPHLRFPRRSLKHRTDYKQTRNNLKRALLAWSFVNYPMRGELVRLRRIKKDKVLLVKSGGFLPRVVVYNFRRDITRVEATVPSGIRFQHRPVQHYVAQEEAGMMSADEKQRVVMLLEQGARRRNAIMIVRCNNDLLQGLE